MRRTLTAATHQTDCNRDGRARGDVVAICVEHDYVMQGRDQHEAVTALAEAIEILAADGPLAGPPPAEEVGAFTGPRVSFDVRA